MSFTPGTDTFHCTDCGAEITLEQHRRKVPRCDECEDDVEVRAFDARYPTINEENHRGPAT